MRLWSSHPARMPPASSPPAVPARLRPRPAVASCRRHLHGLGRRWRGTSVVCLVGTALAGAALAASCGGPEGGSASAPGGTVAGEDRVLPLGTYVVRSRARFGGATLRYYDAGFGGSPSGDLVLPEGTGRYEGSISPRGRDTVVIGMGCRCPVGTEGRYDDLAYGGRYVTRALGGARFELREVDSYGTPAVDTVERR